MHRYSHAHVCSCTCMFMHRYDYAQVRSFTGALTDRYVHAHVLSCTFIDALVRLFAGTFMQKFVMVCAYVHTEVPSRRGMFMHKYLHADEHSCTRTFMHRYYHPQVSSYKGNLTAKTAGSGWIRLDPAGSGWILVF